VKYSSDKGGESEKMPSGSRARPGRCCVRGPSIRPLNRLSSWIARPLLGGGPTETWLIATATERLKRPMVSAAERKGTGGRAVL